jgi:hypothetical protein
MPWILGAVALLGVFNATALGFAQQLVAQQSHVGNRQGDTVALSLGYVMSGPLVLVLQALLATQPDSPRWRIFAFYEAVAVITACGLVSAMILVRRIFGEAEQESSAGEPLLQGGVGQSEEPLLHGGGGQSEEPPPDAQQDTALHYEAVESSSGMATQGESILGLALLAAALALSVGSSSLLFPFFTFVQSSGLVGMMLPKALFWARVLADVSGRVALRFIPPPSPPLLLSLALLKAASLSMAFMYVRGTLLPAHSDIGAITYVGLQWLMSGFLNAACYTALPAAVAPLALRRAAAGLTLAFQSACLLGLAGAFIVQLCVRMHP